ncbi:hypothetical protein JZ00_03615 [Pseudomonas frederiksbergensis]|uniref:DUF4019 domain-containing protein n=2 Tax=Pseudomonas frederiksbergensis TaxID=104087 RepID=A0A0B1Z5I2_9PSED|nr:hypothetical protein JZ00_03615 [Pseudomonas frederiksbergensis]
MVLAFIFGVIFVSIILYLSVTNPTLNSFTRMIFLVVLSLAAGGVGGILPGFIIAGDPNKLVRAGGALAVFLVVLYFGSRFIPPTPDPLTKPVADPSLTSNKFVTAIDTAKYEEAYELTSKAFKTEMNYFFFTENSKKITAKLGIPNSRSMVEQKIMESPAGMAAGFYCYTTYTVDYSKSSVKIYQNINLIGEKETNTNEWRIFGAWFYIKDSSGNFRPVDFNSPDPL